MALLNDAFTVPLLIFGKFTSFIIYTYALHAFKIWGLIAGKNIYIGLSLPIIIVIIPVLEWYRLKLCMDVCVGVLPVGWISGNSYC